MKWQSITAVFFALLLTGCSFDFAAIDWAVLNPMGEVASQELRLLIIAVLLMLIVIIPVFIMVGYFSWQFRAGNKKATYKPDWAHNTLLEVVWWTIPCLIIVVLATITWISTHKLDPYRPIESSEKPIKIQVVALDWKWLFIYPEYNIATVNEIHFPVDTPLNFEITADAPMNSFVIPQLGGHIYAMQGMETKLHLIANKPGQFKGYSGHYSGAGFSGMKFLAHAVTKDEFKNWIESAKKSGKTLNQTSYDVLAKPTENNKPEYFANVESTLYKSIITKFMTHNSGDHSKHEMQSHVPGREPNEKADRAVIYEQVPDKSKYNDFPSNIKANKETSHKKGSVNPDNAAGIEKETQHNH